MRRRDAVHPYRQSAKISCQYDRLHPGQSYWSVACTFRHRFRPRRPILSRRRSACRHTTGASVSKVGNIIPREGLLSSVYSYIRDKLSTTAIQIAPSVSITAYNHVSREHCDSILREDWRRSHGQCCPLGLAKRRQRRERARIKQTS
jgi:hypothetical protein